MVVQISRHVYGIPIVDNDLDLFESLWPVDGVNYNAYVVVGSEGAAVIDTVHRRFYTDFLGELRSVVDPSDIKYIVSQHAEPDHASSIPFLLKDTGAKLVVSKPGAAMHSWSVEPVAVGNGDKISLGDVELSFHLTPWVHWPETMVTLLDPDRVAFTCDLFGAYGPYPDLTPPDWPIYVSEARRYYATVLSKYARSVSAAVAKVRTLNPEIIAPGHGVYYTGDTLVDILDLYGAWTSGAQEDRVVILYASMYGKAANVAEMLSEILSSAGADVDAFDLAREDWSDVLSFLLGAKVAVIVYPVYESDVFPPVRFFLQMAADKGLLPDNLFAVELYGWGSARQRFEAIVGSVTRFLSYGPKNPPSLDDLEGLAADVLRLVSTS